MIVITIFIPLELKDNFESFSFTFSPSQRLGHRICILNRLPEGFSEENIVLESHLGSKKIKRM